MPNLNIPFAAANGGIDYAILTAKNPVFPYTEGKRTSDVPIYTNITVALQGNAFTTLNVKIEGSIELLPGVENSEIIAACAAIKPMFVRFKNGNINLYSKDKQMHMNETASAVELITPSK